MITIKNTQRKYTINIKRIMAQAQKMLDVLGYGDFDLGIWFTTNVTIRRYNAAYRDKDKPTDILSFPFHTQLKAGKRIVARCPDDRNLGDLIISAEYVAADAQKRWGCSLDDRLTVLLAHGIAHLLGYDHENDVDFRAMQVVEKKLLKAGK